MADYHSPTIVQPDIPEGDMTILERLILSLAFDEGPTREGKVYFHSWCGPSDIVSIDVDELRAAQSASTDVASAINTHVAAILEEYDKVDDPDPHDYIDIDLGSAEHGWPRMFQDIVRRSPSVDEIVVTAAFTCTKMRPDGFGGSVMRITADAIEYRSTTDMLEDMRNSPAHPAAIDRSGHETRRRLETIASVAGWDSFTLLLLIAQWIDRNRQTETLVNHLDRLASDDDS